MALAPAAPTAAFPPLPIRIRSILVLGLIAWFSCSLVPRALAGYRVHSLATTVADYAVCMAGPTGPALFRDNPAEFSRLVHRRIVAAAPAEHPFEKCSKHALEITGSAEVARKHGLSAASFAEYGLSGTESASALAVTIEPLVNAAHAAWPFVRGYTALVKPSLGAYEAIHPVGLPRPAVGRGIPGWRAPYRSVKKGPDALWLAFGKGAHLSLHKSTDNGLTWRPASTASAGADFAERCLTGDGRSFEVGLSADHDVLEVTSTELDGTAHATQLAPESSTVYALACDERALVALVRAQNAKSSELYACPFGGRCALFSGPRNDALPGLYDQTLDVARVHGTTVLAVGTKDTVRVSSSRDEGRTWTPFYVAFDVAEHPEVRADVRVPSRLLTIDGRLFLYGGANRATQSYSVLISDDHGASFRTP
ncbi:MAG TPA: sialidase family protein [Polyangiaceae bacterium]|jgi:hypothetical protein|nr:sialidase family protein [Polyangiaceae bacterium]